LKTVKIMRKNLLLYFPLFLILFQSCTTSSNKALKNDLEKMTQENYIQLNGIYYNHPKQVYGKNKKRMISEGELRTKNIYAILNFRPYTFDSIAMFENEEKIELIFLNNQKLKLNHIVNGKVIASPVLNGKIKKGFFCLEQKNSNSWGIPVLHGGYNRHNRKIGISKQGNLIVDLEFEESGSFLLFFSHGFQDITTYEVEKIK